MKKLVSLILLLTLLATPSQSYSQTGAALELVGSLSALQQLRSQIDSVINTVDQETAARMRQAEIAIDATISRIKDAMDHGYGLFTNTRDQVMSNIATTMVMTQEAVQESIGTAVLGVNDSLANVARIATSLPLIDVPTYIYAVTPLRLQVHAQNRHVEVHGFFPDVSASHPALVHFSNGQSKSLDSYIDNTLGFDLPPDLLTKEATYIEMSFELPVKHWGGIHYSTSYLKARVYVEKTTPFLFDVVVNVGNPAQWAVVDSPKPFELHADSSAPTNIQTFTPTDLFSSLIKDNVNYDMSTAKFVAFNTGPLISAQMPTLLGITLGSMFRVSNTDSPITQNVNPCASGCTSSTGSWSWDSNTLRISLYAPSCPTHYIYPGGLQIPYQCGGGTHADFIAYPTFSVARRNVERKEVPSLSKQLKMRHKAISETIPLPSQWTSIEIRGFFEDGKEHRENFARLTSGEKGQLSASDPIFWKAEISGQSLILSTR